MAAAATTTSVKLEDQAASAALNSHKGQKANKKSAHSSHDDDNRLASTSASQVLKYAKPQDLPSFPSAGLKMSSAGAAASLADSNKKTFELWKPGAIPAANRAALLAKDYEMDPLWKPELSAAGSKAALIAHKETPTIEAPKFPPSAEGQSAAGSALKAKPATKKVETEAQADGHRRALMAATGAMTGNRPRAGSVPVAQNDTKSWALKAATKSHRDSPGLQPFASGDPGFEAARIQNMAKNNVNRQLYGSAPPVDIEVEEKNRQDTLRASAVAMAQKMYAAQQSHNDDATGARRTDSRAAATSSHRRNPSDGVTGDRNVTAAAPRYENLEDAARRLAQERLAKLHDEHAEYRSYYGASNPPPRSRLSVRLRRRASTGAEDDSDEEQSRRIRKQMSLFTNNLAEVDKNKRQADRDKLLELAQKNVDARMNKMDQKVFHDTGKSSPAQRDLWDRQAREKAQQQVELTRQHNGKVHIGGGQYLDQDEVDAIAKARLQPTLDDINDKAEKQRARDEEIRLEQERLAADTAKAKARDAEVKAEIKAAEARDKAEVKAKKEEEKRVLKEQNAAERETKKAEADAEKERLRMEKDEKKRQKDNKPSRLSSILHRKSVSSPTQSADTPVSRPSETITETTSGGETVHDAVTVPHQVDEQPSVSHTPPRSEDTTTVSLGKEEVATSPSKRDSKVASWFKTHLRSPSKAQKDSPSGAKAGASEDTREDSIRDVAMVGRTAETRDLYGSAASAPHTKVRSPPTGPDARSPSVSSLSSSDADVAPVTTSSRTETHEETSSKSRGLKQKLLGKIKPSRDQAAHDELHKTATTEDEFEEARDTFETLSPPAPVVGERPRSSHEGSKFKEEL